MAVWSGRVDVMESTPVAVSSVKNAVVSSKLMEYISLPAEKRCCTFSGTGVKSKSMVDVEVAMTCTFWTAATAEMRHVCRSGQRTAARMRYVASSGRFVCWVIGGSDIYACLVIINGFLSEPSSTRIAMMQDASGAFLTWTSRLPAVALD